MVQIFHVLNFHPARLQMKIFNSELFLNYDSYIVFTMIIMPYIGISSEGELGMLHCPCAVMIRVVLKLCSLCSCKRFVLKISLLSHYSLLADLIW